MMKITGAKQGKPAKSWLNFAIKIFDQPRRRRKPKLPAPFSRIKRVGNEIGAGPRAIQIEVESV